MYWEIVLKMARNMKMWPRVKCKQHEAVCQLAAIQKQQEVLCRSLCFPCCGFHLNRERILLVVLLAPCATCFNLFNSVKQQTKTTTE